ncbi:MAG: ArsR family transcriptional regulator [Halorientalis sp.]
MESAPIDNRSDERTLKDCLFEALSRSTRRRVLRSLEASGGTTTVAQLCTELAVGSSELPLDEESRLAYQETLVSLVHVHLPKLRAAGLIQWDGNVVSLSDHASLLPLSTPLEKGLLDTPFADKRPPA